MIGSLRHSTDITKPAVRSKKTSIGSPSGIGDSTVSQPARGLLSAKVPNSSFAEVRMGLLVEPTHMDDEEEDQEKERKMRETVKSAKWSVEENQNNHCA